VPAIRRDDSLISLRGVVDDLEHGCNVGLAALPDHSTDALLRTKANIVWNRIFTFPS
jgi:hypothetical protein